jgi:hypothetical protein
MDHMGIIWNCVRCNEAIDSHVDDRVSLRPDMKGDNWTTLLCERCGKEIAHRFGPPFEDLDWKRVIRAHVVEIREALGLDDDFEMREMTALNDHEKQWEQWGNDRDVGLITTEELRARNIRAVREFCDRIQAEVDARRVAEHWPE